MNANFKDKGNPQDGYHSGEEMPSWTGNLDNPHKARPELVELEKQYGIEVEIQSPVVDKLLELGDTLHWKQIDPKTTINNPDAAIVDEVIMIYIKNDEGESPISLFGLKKNTNFGLRYKYKMVIIDTDTIKSAAHSVVVKMNNSSYAVGVQTISRGSKSGFRR